MFNVNDDKNLNQTKDPIQVNEDVHHDLDLRGTMAAVLALEQYLLSLGLQFLYYL